MDHRIVELDGFDAVGLRCECPGMDTSAIGPLWEQFFHGGGTPLPGSQGVVGVSWGDGAGGFSYMAAYRLPVDSGEAAAQAAGGDFVSHSVPGGRYVGVQWQGQGGPEMSAAFQDIFRRIIPKNSLSVAPDGVCVEDYPEHAYDPATQTLKAELLVKVV